jgi:hypothetical protein
METAQRVHLTVKVVAGCRPRQHLDGMAGADPILPAHDRHGPNRYLTSLEVHRYRQGVARDGAEKRACLGVWLQQSLDNKVISGGV